MVDIFPVQGSLNPQTGMIGTRPESSTIPVSRDGLDAVFFTVPMNDQLKTLEDRMLVVMRDANLSDVQRQFDLQKLMNTWSAVSQAMTNMLKAVSDVNKAIVHNIE
jgi:hypothetical protein